MAANNEEFHKSWIANTLGRKIQCGSYHVVKMDNADFLCYNKHGEQALIAMRCSRSGRIVYDKQNQDEFLSYDLNQVINTNPVRYRCTFAFINEQSHDLSEIRLVDMKEVTNPRGPIALILFDVNGQKFYTESLATSYNDSYCSYVEYKDIAESKANTLLLSLIRTDNSCNTIEQARALNVPPMLRGADFKILNNYYLLKSPDVNAEIPSEIKQASRWEPQPLGWDLPQEIMDGETLQYKWKPWNLNFDSFILKSEGTLTKADAKLAIAWRKAWQKWRDATDFITMHTKMEASDYEMLARTGDFWRENESTVYIRGIVQTCNEIGRTNADSIQVDLGNIWHRLEMRSKLDGK